MIRKNLQSGGIVAVALLTALTACDRALLHDPAEERLATLALDLTLPASSGGPAEAFDKGDRVVVRLLEGDLVRLERTVTVQPDGRDVNVPLQIELKRPNETLSVQVELRRGDAALFRGSASVQLRVGRTSSAPLPMLAVAHGIALPDSLPSFDVYGDSVRVQAAIIFATGDTVSLGAVEEWTTLDPAVVAIVDGVPVVLGDGQVRLVGRVGTARDTMLVRVYATVHSIVIDPPLTQLPVGGSRQYTARLFDRRGNPIPGRTVSWGSSDTSVVRIDPSGLATGMGPGLATITAASDPQVATLALNALPGAPGVVTDSAELVTTTTAMLRSTVQPNAAPTELWFEVDTDSLFPSPRITTTLLAGLSNVQISSLLGSLFPSTTYFVRAVARNQAGTVKGNIQRFTTLPAFLHVTTGGVTDVTATSATLTGAIVPAGAPATAWVQWSTDPNFANPFSTAPQPVPPNLSSVPLLVPIVGLSPNTTYYYRVVGNNAAGTVFGAILSFNTTTGTPNTPPPAVTTLAESGVAASSATLNGSVNPNGFATNAWFEWGTDPLLATFTQTTPSPLGTGAAAVAVAAPITGLAASTTYYFRAAASNGGGTSRGVIRTFTTGSGSGSTPQTATTLLAAPIFADSARLNASVDPNGQATTAWFEWGTDPALAAFSSTPTQAVGSGTAAVAVNLMLKGLAPNTTYYFRVATSSAAGTVNGAILSFMTATAASPTAPLATTLPALPVRADTAVANGIVNPKGLPTTVWFEWGTSPTLAGASTTLLQSAGSGNSDVAVAELMLPLTPGMTYYYRVVAANTNADTTRGAILSFRADPPPATPVALATTLAPTNEALASVTMNGSADPQSSAAVVWFEWGTDANLTAFRRTTPRPIGSSGTSLVAEALTGITRPPRVYYFRVVVMNAAGTVRGAIRVFELN